MNQQLGFSRVLVTGGVSSRFQERVERQLLQLHPAVPAILRDGKIEIALAPTVVDYFPSLANVKPRGWDAGSTWASAEGLYSSSNRLVLIAERKLHQNGNLDLSPREGAVLVHEIGHGVDRALGHFSRSPEFIRAYLSDFARIVRYPPVLQAKLGYFVQGFDLKGTVFGAGLTEAYAEVFALIHGRCCNPTEYRLLKRSFRNTEAAVRRALMRA